MNDVEKIHLTLSPAERTEWSEPTIVLLSNADSAAGTGKGGDGYVYASYSKS